MLALYNELKYYSYIHIVFIKTTFVTEIPAGKKLILLLQIQASIF